MDTENKNDAVEALDVRDGYACALKCFCCGKEANIEVAQPPQFAFEIAGWAKDIGWVGVIDHYRGRSVVFCSDACFTKAKTKQGTIKARPLYSHNTQDQTRP